MPEQASTTPPLDSRAGLAARNDDGYGALLSRGLAGLQGVEPVNTYLNAQLIEANNHRGGESPPGMPDAVT